jgi:nucleotide-binding universal stress UspA family protein
MLYKRILVPVDGSNTSNHALQEALRVAKDQQATVRLVHVVDEAVIDGEIDGIMNYAALRDALKQAGTHLLAKVAKTAKQAGVEVETVLLETIGEHAGHAITREAKSWQADLIVMGTHGRHGLDRLFMGSVSEGTARLAPVPLLLVRSE